MNTLRWAALAAVVSVSSIGCSGAGADPSEPTGSSAQNLLGLPIGLPPLVTCNFGLGLVDVAFEALPAHWDSSDFDASLQSDLGNPNQSPTYLQPRGASNAWDAFPLPDGYPSSITDLVAAYADVDPVDATIVTCTTTNLLSDGQVLGISQGSYVVWDPRTGGTGGIPRWQYYQPASSEQQSEQP